MPLRRLHKLSLAQIPQQHQGVRPSKHNPTLWETIPWRNPSQRTHKAGVPGKSLRQNLLVLLVRIWGQEPHHLVPGERRESEIATDTDATNVVFMGSELAAEVVLSGLGRHGPLGFKEISGPRRWQGDGGEVEMERARLRERRREEAVWAGTGRNGDGGRSHACDADLGDGNRGMAETFARVKIVEEEGARVPDFDRENVEGG